MPHLQDGHSPEVAAKDNLLEMTRIFSARGVMGTETSAFTELPFECRMHTWTHVKGVNTVMLCVPADLEDWNSVGEDVTNRRT